MLAYTDLGKGTPIVFIHGLGSKKEAWKHQHELAKNHRMIMVDLRGHGETVLDEDITLHNFANDIIKLLERIGVVSTYLCGLSLGGIVAQEIYKQRPDMIKGMILANTTSFIPRMFTYVVTTEAKRAFEDGSLIEDIVARGLYSTEYENDAREAFYIRDSYLESSKAAIGLNYFPNLYSIKVPVLLIGSSHDNVTPVANMNMMKLFIPKSEIVVFNKTGHLSNIEQKEKFNKCVDNFINKL